MRCSQEVLTVLQNTVTGIFFFFYFSLSLSLEGETYTRRLSLFIIITDADSGEKDVSLNVRNLIKAERIGEQNGAQLFEGEEEGKSAMKTRLSFAHSRSYIDTCK